MKRSLLGLTVMVIASILLMSLSNVQAASKPVVVSHDETYANKAVRFRVVWQSENPVVMVRIFAGKDHKEFKIEEYDNRRTRDGYSGELSTIVELDPSFMEESLAYVVQVEDDVRLKSDPVHGKIQIVKARDPYGVAGSLYMGIPQQPPGGMPQQPMGGMPQQPMGGMPQQPMGGMPQQPMGQPGVGSTVEVINQVTGIMAVIDLPPKLGKIVITKIGADGISIGVSANDDKGLAGVAFKIFDNAGNQVQQDMPTITGKTWEGSSKFFNLVNGNYKAVVQATDSSGNKSPENSEFFAITGVPTTDTSSQQQTQ